MEMRIAIRKRLQKRAIRHSLIYKEEHERTINGKQFDKEKLALADKIMRQCYTRVCGVCPS